MLLYIYIDRCSLNLFAVIRSESKDSGSFGGAPKQTTRDQDIVEEIETHPPNYSKAPTTLEEKA